MPSLKCSIWTGNQNGHAKSVLRQGTRIIKCPYDKFSDADKAYIREQMEADRTKSKRRTGVNQIGGPVASEVTDDGAHELRTWSDLQGNKILAQYTGFSREDIELLKEGKRVSYPYAAFSAADQAYVAGILTAEGRADEIPKVKQEGEEAGYGGSSRQESDYGESDVNESDSMESDYGSSSPDYEVSSRPGSSGYESEDDYEEDYEAESGGPDFPGGAYPSSDSHGPDFPSQSSSPFMQPQMVMQKQCMECQGIVPDSTKVGDRCPHCDVTFGYEVGEDGKRTSSGESWRYRRSFVRFGILGVLIVMGALGALFRR